MEHEHDAPRNAAPVKSDPWHEHAPTAIAAAVEAISTPSPSPRPPSFGEVRTIPVDKILVRKGTNRDESSFEGEEFELLVDSIRAAGGNTIPVILRYLVNPEDGCEVELVAGERRLRACKQARVDVTALVLRDCTDEFALSAKLVENALRRQLSPYELGCQINVPGPDGKRISLRHAEMLTGHDKSDLSKVRRLADLDQRVLAVVPNKTELQYRHEKVLNDALARDRQAVLAEADRIALLEVKPSTKEVVSLLEAAATGGVGPSHPRLEGEPIEVDGLQVGQCKLGKGGTLTLSLSVPLDRRQHDALLKCVEGFYRRRVLKKPPTTPSDTETPK